VQRFAHRAASRVTDDPRRLHDVRAGGHHDIGHDFDDIHYAAADDIAAAHRPAADRDHADRDAGDHMGAGPGAPDVPRDRQSRHVPVPDLRAVG
jgi:hypothetical protein